MAPPTARSLVIDCNDTLAGLSFRGPLQAAGWCVVDAVQMLEALSLPHTYVDVDVERSTILDQLSGYVEVSQWCSDALSRATLQARLQAMVALDRRGLVQVAQPFGLFTQAPDSRAALRVRPTDVYVDVGAAYGDTVSEFVQASGGQYGAIEAFEPDPVHVRALELLCSVLPRATAHACGVGEKAASLDFQEAPDNRFGSHFISAAPTMEPPVAACAALAAPVPPVKVPVVRLDDVIDHADLIKIDVEGFEAQVLRGGAALIARSRPSLHVSGYHGPSDLPELTRLLRALHPYQHCVIRHYGGSLYDTNLLVSDRQAFAVGR
jgi:FkbM family methyltransferase